MDSVVENGLYQAINIRLHRGSQKVCGPRAAALALMKVRTIEICKTFRINQPIETLFPLFSAEGEKLWVPEWDYENIMGSNDLHED